MDIHIAIIEDDNDVQTQIKKWLLIYAKEKGHELNIQQYLSAEKFLQETNTFDIVFMDIDLPGIDGLSCAQKLRKKDQLTVLVFVTNMAQLAIRGYEVAAIDFMVKPLIYSDFIFKLQRIFRAVARRSQSYISVCKHNEIYRFAANDLQYVEICNHRLIYHLKDGQFDVYGKLSAAEEQLSPYGFLKCNRCFLINPVHIRAIKGNTVTVGETELQISRPQKKLFCQQLNNWLNGKGK